MTEQKTWGAIGRELVKKLEGVTDEAAIKALGDATMKDILNREPTAKGRTNALRMVNREVDKQYPRLESEAPLYWHDPKGKKTQPKWRHLIFKSLTLSTADWDEAGDKSRQQWQAQQQREVEQPSRPEKDGLNFEDLIIGICQFEPETHALVKEAIAHSGMTLADFTRQALRVYAKTITGKTRKQSEDLATVPTETLLGDPTYSTHPGRAEELTKRAIRAIKYYNANVATENADRWCITQSSITKLTGSRASTVGKILEQFKDEIESHNETYGLNDYSNRKQGKKLEETINLAALMPDGLD